MIEATICRRPRERDDALAVRVAVFVDEQGIAREDEIDEHDTTDAVHCVAYEDGRPVGAGRLVIDGERGMIGRMAVLRDCRGRGVGAAVLRALEAEGLERGLRHFKLSAQTHATGFYERCGYTAYGEVYEDVGIPHVDMKKLIG
jgi:predicted GNAT family N-acyltransferase